MAAVGVLLRRDGDARRLRQRIGAAIQCHDPPSRGLFPRAVPRARRRRAALRERGLLLQRRLRSGGWSLGCREDELELLVVVIGRLVHYVARLLGVFAE